MQAIRDYLRGFSVLLSDVAAGCLCLSVIAAVAPVEQFSLAWELWALFLAGLFLIDDILAGIGIPLNGYLLGNGAAVLAGAWGVIRFSVFMPRYDSFVVCLAFLAAFTGVHGAVAAYRLPGSNGLLRYVDVLVVLAGFYLYTVYATGKEPDGKMLLLSVLALVADLTVVNQLRTGDEAGSVIHGTGMGGKLLLAALAGGCLLLTAFLVGRASGQIHSAVDILLVILGIIWKGIELFFSALAYVLAAVILFLMRLLPDGPGMVMEQAPADAGAMAEEAVEEGSGLLPAWVPVLLVALILLGCLIYGLYLLRHTRLRRRLERAERQKVVRDSHFFGELAALFRRIAGALRFEWEYRTHRRTPQGLFVYAERTGRRRWGRRWKHLRRRRDESPGEYIRRLAVVWEQIPQADGEHDRAPQLALENGHGLQPDGKNGCISQLVQGNEQGLQPDRKVGQGAWSGPENPLRELAEILDRVCYGPCGPEEGSGKARMDRSRYRACVRAIEKVYREGARA